MNLLISQVIKINRDNKRTFRLLSHLPLIGAILGGSIFFAIDLISHSREVSDGTLESWILKDENLFSNSVSPETTCSILITSSINNQKLAVDKIQNILDLIAFENTN